MKETKIAQFDPNAPSMDDTGVYGLPFTAEESDIILVPVPWEATVSYGSGASEGPEAIREASSQVDLCHYDFPDLWKRGIFMEDSPEKIQRLNDDTKPEAALVIDALVRGEDVSAQEKAYQRVNRACEEMVEWVKTRTRHWVDQGKKVGLVGGDHSVPLGYLHTLAEDHSNFGILVIDAHMDLRKAYEGFTYSHASIFYNTLERLPQVSKMVQVGIRDYCHEEKLYCEQHPQRIGIYFDRTLRERQFKGESWDSLCREIVDSLPEKVYVTVDIDGFDPKLCPHTGTPVPGGMEYEEVIYLLNTLHRSGKTVIGFDLCEVAPGETDWDGNVGARVLFQLCGLL